MHLSPSCFLKKVAMHRKDRKIEIRWEACVSYDHRNMLSRKCGPWQKRAQMYSMGVCRDADRNSVA